MELITASPRIASLSQANLSLWAKTLLVKIHAITGWVLPQGNMLTILVDQFRKKMNEAYSQLNPDEIEHAFRTRGTTVSDYGKLMNLALIDSVLIPYLQLRSEICRQAAGQYRSIEQRIYTDEEIVNIYREDIENFYQRMIRGSKEKIPEYFRDVLMKDGHMQLEETVESFFERKRSKGADKLYQKCE